MLFSWSRRWWVRFGGSSRRFADAQDEMASDSLSTLLFFGGIQGREMFQFTSWPS